MTIAISLDYASVSFGTDASRNEDHVSTNLSDVFFRTSSRAWEQCCPYPCHHSTISQFHGRAKLSHLCNRTKNMVSNVKSRSSRIPQSLQAVFIASNRGNDVHVPPPAKVASKVYTIRLLRRGSNDSVDSTCSSCTTSRAMDIKMPLQCYREAPQIRQIRRTRSNDRAPVPSLSPQTYFDALIRSRGHSVEKFKCLQTAYYNKPTELQQASYHVHLIELVRAENVFDFEQLLLAGISPNPCNAYGESLVHMVCRRGESSFLKVLLENGCNLQVADDYGRTPLHDACWAARPCFSVVKMILDVDPRMFQMMDCRGATPLSYVPKKDWAAWLQFLEYYKDDYWPVRDLARDGAQTPPELARHHPNSHPILDPPNALAPPVASMLSSGAVPPNEVHLYTSESAEGDKICLSDFDEDDDTNTSSHHDEDDDELDDDDCSFDADEMEEILCRITRKKKYT